MRVRSLVTVQRNNMNRPLFARERLVRMLGCFFIWVQGCMEHFLCFMRRDISDGAVQALGVVPIDPFQRFPALLMAWKPPPTGIVVCHSDVSENITQRESIHVRS